MPPLPLLTQKEALSLACDATSDFPGLKILIQPVFTPRPLTDSMRVEGFVLIVAGPRYGTPWFEMRSALGYEHLYDAVYAHYDVLDIAQDTEPDDDAPDDTAPVPDVPPLAMVVGRKARKISS